MYILQLSDLKYFMFKNHLLCRDPTVWEPLNLMDIGILKLEYVLVFGIICKCLLNCIAKRRCCLIITIIYLLSFINYTIFANWIKRSTQETTKMSWVCIQIKNFAFNANNEKN